MQRSLFFLKARLVFKAHLLNPFWKSRDERRRFRGKVIAEEVCAYLSDRYVKNAEMRKMALSDGKDRVFTMWLSRGGKVPKLVRNCIASMQDKLDNEVVVLTDKNLFNWITLPDDIVKLYLDGRIRPCHFADICRVELLYEHGGFWLDATCFVSGPIPDVIHDADFFVYMAGDQLRGSYSYIQNCFIRAKRGSQLLSMWRDVIFNYWRNETSVADYFVHQLLFKSLVQENSEAAALFAAMPKLDQTPTHLAWYKWGCEEYHAEELEKLEEKGYFFQKTSYKDHSKIVDGSFRDYITK